MIEHKDIHEAVIAIMHEIGYVQKQKSANLNYSYAGEAALIAALRPVMIEHGVYCYVSKIVPSREAFTTAKGTFMNVTVSQGEVTFTHSKSGTSITVQAIGEGMDVGDKSANKSATGLLKYALRQTFLIETGDDPDSHESKQMERAKASTITGNGHKKDDGKKDSHVWSMSQKQVLIDNKLADNDFAAKGMLGLSNLPADATEAEILKWGRVYRQWRDTINPETGKKYLAPEAAAHADAARTFESAMADIQP